MPVHYRALVENGMNILSLITFLPLAGALLVLALPKEKERTVQIVSLVFSGLSLVLSGALFFLFNRQTADMQFVERLPWIPSIGVQYFMGVDGLSYPLILLTTLLTFVSLIASLNKTSPFNKAGHNQKICQGSKSNSKI